MVVTSESFPLTLSVLACCCTVSLRGDLLKQGKIVKLSDQISYITLGIILTRPGTQCILKDSDLL